MFLFGKGENRRTEHFKDVYDEYFQTIVRFTLKYVRNNLEIAHDIVQESFIELWIGEVIDEDIEHIKAFLYLTSRNKALNYLKHEKVKENYFLVRNSLVESERYYMNQLIEQETIHVVQKAIDKLPDQARKVVLLNLEGLKNKEISQQIGISVNTVKYHKTRAFSILRKSLGSVL